MQYITMLYILCILSIEHFDKRKMKNKRNITFIAIYRAGIRWTQIRTVLSFKSCLYYEMYVMIFFPKVLGIILILNVMEKVSSIHFDHFSIRVCKKVYTGIFIWRGIESNQYLTFKFWSRLFLLVVVFEWRSSSVRNYRLMKVKSHR